MQQRKTFTISLPAKMAKQVEKARNAQNQTRSELVRQALRVYFAGQIPTVVASPAELKALRHGRLEHERGEYVTIDQLLNALGTSRRPVGGKTT